MVVKRSGKHIFGAQFTAAEKKAVELEVSRQVDKALKRYTDDFDAAILWTLHTVFGFGPKRLWQFYQAFDAEQEKLSQHYEMPENNLWLCREELKAIGVDVEAWNKGEYTDGNTAAENT